MDILKKRVPYFINIDWGTSLIKCLARKGSQTARVEIESYAIRTAEVEKGKQRENCLAFPEQYMGSCGGYVGKVGAAILDLNQDFYDTEEFPLLTFLCTAKLLDEMNAEETVDVVLSLAIPSDHIEKAGAIEAHLKKTWPVGTQTGKKRRVNITHVFVKRQPECIIFDQLMTWKAVNSHVELDDSRGDALMDKAPIDAFSLGSRSLDRMYFDGSFSRAIAKSEFIGTFNLMDALRNKFFGKHGERLKDYEAMYHAFKEGKVTIENETYHTATLSRMLTEQFIKSEMFKKYMNTFWNKLPANPEFCILGGGGVFYGEQAFREQFEKRYAHGVVVTRNDNGNPNPVWTVAEGLDKAAQYTYAQL